MGAGGASCELTATRTPLTASQGAAAAPRPWHPQHGDPRGSHGSSQQPESPCPARAVPSSLSHLPFAGALAPKSLPWALRNPVRATPPPANRPVPMATGSRARKRAEVLKNQGEVLKNGARRSKTSHGELGAAGDGQGHGPSLRGQGQQPATEPGCSQLRGSAGFASQLPSVWGQGWARESPPHARALPGGLHRPPSPAAQPGLAGGLQARHIKAAAGERLSHSASPARRAPCPWGRQAGSS